MSILDTFVTIFTADTTGLEQGADRARREADRLIDRLRGVDRAATGASRTLVDMFHEFERGLTVANTTAAAMGAGATIGLGLAGVAAHVTATEFGQLASAAEALGISAQQVDGFGTVLGQFGGDAEMAREALLDLGEAIGTATLDAKSTEAETFAALGVRIRDSSGRAIDAREGFLRLADSLSKLDKAAALSRAKDLGITDPETIYALRLGRQALEEQWNAAAQGSGATEENIRATKEYMLANQGLKNSFGDLTESVGFDVMPTFTELQKLLARAFDWMAENEDVVIGFFVGVAAAATLLAAPLLTLLAPFIAVGLAIAAVGVAAGLAWDDLQAFLEGGDSLIGQFLNRFPELREAWEGLTEWAARAWESIKEFGAQAAEALTPFANSAKAVFKSVGEFASALLDVLIAFGKRIWEVFGDDIIAAFKWMQEVANGVFEWLKRALQGLANFLTNAFNQIAGGFSTGAGVLRTVAGWLGGGDEAGAQQAVAMGQAQMAAAATNPLNAATSQSISNTATSNRRESSVTVGEINVQTQATDAQGIAGAVADPLRDQLRSLDEEFASGVDR
ncbi:phage tail tape measure protein [Azotobacter salinestris]|uniref:phage tail tape measure protein n=1 Tax=Azotobacter salinestris TaxID=69964 RepID=UPI001266C74F|nr:phage tail tape measure protein [Azotobacter salinestris]